MRKFFLRLWQVITFPFPPRSYNIHRASHFGRYRQFNKFLNTEPEEHPLTEVFVDLTTNKDTRQMMWDQVEALAHASFARAC